MNAKQFRRLIREMSALRAGLAAMSKFARLNTSQIMALARRFNRLQERTKNLPLEEVQELVSLFAWKVFPNPWA